MVNYRRSHGLLLYLYLMLITAIFGVGRSGGRELRPSEHGLVYQGNATAAGDHSPDMLSFFGETTATPSVPVPVANNISDGSWSKGVPGDGYGGRKDTVKKVLVVAALVCGATGVGFMLVAGLLFVVRCQRKRPKGSTK